jgi:membrane fusion protein, multidrug efflux system
MKVEFNPGTILKRRLMGRAALPCILAIALAACGSTPKESKQGPPPVIVEVGEVAQKDCPLFLEGIGNVEAYNTVDVKCRVTGQLIKTFFEDGDSLTAGQPLFTIDPAPFEAKVKEAEAKLKQSQVQHEQAIRDFLRFKTLYAEKATSLEQLETKEVDMNSKLHQVELNQAELDSARLNLGYCHIQAPLHGQSGKIFIDNYNIVNANQDTLVNIKQVQPIKVKFSLPGKYLEEIQRYSANGSLQIETFTLGSDKPELGSLSLVDNFINSKTGMITLQGTFPNPGSRLWPGQFVQVRLRLTVTRDALLVPLRAVNEGPEGQFVWVVHEDRTVTMRPIKISRRDKDMEVVAEGLKPGERVVIDGQLQLYPGAKTVTREQVKKRKEGAAPVEPDSNGPRKNRASDAS